MNTKRECLEFMETKEFKAIKILNGLEDCFSVRFLDETLKEAIKELEFLIEDYKNIKKEKNCMNCDKFSKKHKCLINQVNSLSVLLIGHLKPFEFSCNQWEELR